MGTGEGSEEVQPPKPRTVPISADKVIALRRQVGWSAEDLARKSGCSERTIRSIENGEACYPFTLKKIAKAFKLDDPATLLAGDAGEPEGLLYRRVGDDNAPPPAPQASRPVQVKIVYNFDFSSFDETSQLSALLETLARIIGATGEIGVTTITDGSVEVGLELSEGDAMRLVNAFKEGKLNDSNVSTIEFPRNPALPDTAKSLASRIMSAAARLRYSLKTFSRTPPQEVYDFMDKFLGTGIREESELWKALGRVPNLATVPNLPLGVLHTHMIFDENGNGGVMVVFHWSKVTLFRIGDRTTE